MPENEHVQPPMGQEHSQTQQPHAQPQPTSPGMPKAQQDIEIPQSTEANHIRDPNHGKSQESQLNRYERWSLMVNTLTMIAVSVYAYFAWGQWEAMNKALKLTEDSMTLTQQTVRAWLVISKIERTSDFSPNTPITFNMTLKNVGPSTALNMTFEMADWVCDGPPSLSCASQCPPPLAHDEHGGDTIIGPQIEPFIEINLSPRPQDVLTAIQRGTKTVYYNVPQKLDHPISLEEGHGGERTHDEVATAA
jgi:hypothetical protein